MGDQTSLTTLQVNECFATPNPTAEYVSHTDCSLICVRGNHEDHAFLDRLETAAVEPIFPVDCHQRMFVMKTGVLQRSPSVAAA